MFKNVKNNLGCAVSVSILFILFAVFTLAVYLKSKSCYEVGYNYGSIDTRIDIIEKVRNSIGIIDVNSCNEMYMDDNFSIIILIEVKTSSLYAMKYDNKLIGFCLAE